MYRLQVCYGNPGGWLILWKCYQSCTHWLNPSACTSNYAPPLIYCRKISQDHKKTSNRKQVQNKKMLTNISFALIIFIPQVKRSWAEHIGWMISNYTQCLLRLNVRSLSLNLYLGPNYNSSFLGNQLEIFHVNLNYIYKLVIIHLWKCHLFPEEVIKISQCYWKCSPRYKNSLLPRLRLTLVCPWREPYNIVSVSLSQ